VVDGFAIFKDLTVGERMKKILIVDDMAIFHEPIAAVLRLSGYEALCASSGAEAIQLALENTPDLILLDVVMPEMDGVACLKRMRANPKIRGIPVVMLTATGERSTVLEAAHLGVQGYILKSSFSKDTLLSTVARVLSGAPESVSPTLAAKREVSRPTTSPTSRESESAPTTPRLTRSAVLARIRHQMKIRPVPPVMSWVMQLTHSDSTSLDEIVSVIRQDQSLSLRVMKASNSSFYSSSKRARNVMEAAQRIGMAGIRNAAAAITAMDHFSEADTSGLVPQRFLEHALATGILAQILGQAVPDQDPEQLFLAGLFHDVGRMLLSASFPDAYRQTLGEIGRHRGNLTAAEAATLGVHHAEITAFVLKEWKIAEPIVTAAALHELDVIDVERSAHAPQGALIVALANRLAHALALGHSGNDLLLPTADHQRALGITDERLEAIIRDGLEKFNDAAAFFASQTWEAAPASLVDGLTGSAGRVGAVTVSGPTRMTFPIKTFLVRLGWLDDASPDTAVLVADSEAEFARCLFDVERRERDLARDFALVLVTPDDRLRSHSGLPVSRALAHLAYPVRFTDLIAATGRSACQSAPGVEAQCAT